LFKTKTAPWWASFFARVAAFKAALFLLVQTLGCFGDCEQVCFLERLANPLEANRESACHTARNAHARETGKTS
jgi:hypothetical protein